MERMKYFKASEFDSPDRKGSGLLMNKDFLNKLDLARQLAGIPFKINSGYRTKEHNEKVGGTEHSSHLKGLACDISATRSRDRFLILSACIKAGFTRIGVGKTFIHVDLDEEKPNRVTWLY